MSQILGQLVRKLENNERVLSFDYLQIISVLQDHETRIAGTAVASPILGGTGVANNPASTLTITGNFGINFTITGSTAITLPESGTLLASNGSGANLSGIYKLLDGGILTGPNIFIATATNTIEYRFSGLNTTVGKHFMLSTSSLAAAGAQQIGGAFVLRSAGWATGSGGSSQYVDFFQRVLPIQGTTSPSGSWILSVAINEGTNNDVLSVRSDGNFSLLGGTSTAPTLNFGSDGQAAIIRSLSGTNGMTLYGPAAQATYTLSLSSFASNNYSGTTSTAGVLALIGNFTPASGSQVFNYIAFNGTINMTGSSSGAVALLRNTQTITSAKSDYFFLDHNPTVTTISGIHYAFRATSGNVLIGGTALTTSAILDLQSTTRAFIPPRMTTTQKNAIATPSAGMVVYDTTLNKLCVYTTGWETITSA